MQVAQSITQDRHNRVAYLLLVALEEKVVVHVRVTPVRQHRKCHLLLRLHPRHYPCRPVVPHATRHLLRWAVRVEAQCPRVVVRKTLHPCRKLCHYALWQRSCVLWNFALVQNDPHVVQQIRCSCEVARMASYSPKEIGQSFVGLTSNDGLSDF